MNRNININQDIHNPPWGNLFLELCEQAFILQSIEELEPNIFVNDMMNFFFQMPQFSNREFNNQQFININAALSSYLQNMYDYYFNDMYDDEQTIDTTNSLINAVIELQ